MKTATGRDTARKNSKGYTVGSNHKPNPPPTSSFDRDVHETHVIHCTETRERHPHHTQSSPMSFIPVYGSHYAWAPAFWGLAPRPWMLLAGHTWFCRTWERLRITAKSA